MAIPHNSAPSPTLAAAMKLPEPKVAAPETGGGERRRRRRG
jgi:hypothetical protein